MIDISKLTTKLKIVIGACTGALLLLIVILLSLLYQHRLERPTGASTAPGGSAKGTEFVDNSPVILGPTTNVVYPHGFLTIKVNRDSKLSRDKLMQILQAYDWSPGTNQGLIIMISYIKDDKPFEVISQLGLPFHNFQ